MKGVVSIMNTFKEIENFTW